LPRRAKSLSSTPTGAHLIAYQVRLIFASSHLNGVQVVAGSNPAAPTTTLHHRHHRSNYLPQSIFCPHCYSRHSSHCYQTLTPKAKKAAFMPLSTSLLPLIQLGKEVTI